MAFVAGVALILLMYVGYGEATRTLQQFQVEKLPSQGRYLQSTMNDFLQPGHPIKQFVGFNAKSGNILASDQTIGAIAEYDNASRPVFTNGPLGGDLLPGVISTSTTEAHDGFQVRANDNIVQVLLPLNNRFEQWSAPTEWSGCNVSGFAGLTLPRTLDRHPRSLSAL
jgi:hypothetical protein